MLVASVSVSSTSDKVTWFPPIYLYFSPWEPLLRPQTYQEWNFSNCPITPPTPRNISPSLDLSDWISTLDSFIAILFIPCCIAKPPSNLPIWNNNHFLRLTILWVRNQGRHSGASLSLSWSNWGLSWGGSNPRGGWGGTVSFELCFWLTARFLCSSCGICWGLDVQDDFFTPENGAWAGMAKAVTAGHTASPSGQLGFSTAWWSQG